MQRRSACGGATVGDCIGRRGVNIDKRNCFVKDGVTEFRYLDKMVN